VDRWGIWPGKPGAAVPRYFQLDSQPNVIFKKTRSAKHKQNVVLAQ